MPVLPRRRHEVRQPVQELKRREFDDAIGSRPRGLSAAAGPDPVGGFVSGQHVADAGCAAVWAASHGESFERKGRPGAVTPVTNPSMGGKTTQQIPSRRKEIAADLIFTGSPRRSRGGTSRGEG